MNEKKDRTADALSAITQERLKRFNEIHGTVAGTAHEEIEAAEFEAKQEDKDKHDQAGAD
jgi:hypothetical protein